MIEKDPAILSVLNRLRARLGQDAFVIADHWECDLCAIGIASPRNRGVLIYISTYAELPEQFSYELELPTTPDDEAIYKDAGRGSAVLFEELVRVVAEHLKLSQRKLAAKIFFRILYSPT